MGSKERIQRLKDENRINILDASLEIVKEEGWQALSMRKIADKIEYTAPMIYEYFANKEAILLELSRRGNMLLLRRMREAKDSRSKPEKQLEAMWLAYWDFAFEEREFYQLMFGVGTTCCALNKSKEGEEAFRMVCSVIREVMKGQDPSDEEVCRKYYTFWSIIHGLISINLVNRGVCDKDNQHILTEAIRGITLSLKS